MYFQGIHPDVFQVGLDLGAEFLDHSFRPGFKIRYPLIQQAGPCQHYVFQSSHTITTTSHPKSI